MTVAHVVDLTGFVDLPIAIYSNIDHAQVNPQCAFNVNCGLTPTRAPRVSRANQTVFQQVVAQVAEATQTLLENLA